VLAEVAGQPGVEVTRGPASWVERDGQDMPIQELAVAADGIALKAVAGAWSCPQAGRLYVLIYARGQDDYDEDLTGRFWEVLDGFECEGEEGSGG
jgi:hypothetical protein